MQTTKPNSRLACKLNSLNPFQIQGRADSECFRRRPLSGFVSRGGAAMQRSAIQGNASRRKGSETERASVCGATFYFGAMGGGGTNAETQSFLNPKNSENFDLNRNQSDAKNDLRKRVCESRLFHLFGFVPAAGRISTVFNAFLSVFYFPAFQHFLEKAAFSFVTSCLRVRRVFNDFLLRSSAPSAVKTAFTLAFFAFFLAVNPAFSQPSTLQNL